MQAQFRAELKHHPGGELLRHVHVKRSVDYADRLLLLERVEQLRRGGMPRTGATNLFLDLARPLALAATLAHSDVELAAGLAALLLRAPRQNFVNLTTVDRTQRGDDPLRVRGARTV